MASHLKTQLTTLHRSLVPQCTRPGIAADSGHWEGSRLRVIQYDWQIQGP